MIKLLISQLIIHYIIITEYGVRRLYGILSYLRYLSSILLWLESHMSLHHFNRRNG